MTRVIHVSGAADLRAFIDMPWAIYAHDAHWVPPLKSDVRFILTENPFWEHAERALFIARDEDGAVTGRIAAIIDRNYISFQNDQAGFFGFFECINDGATARLLYEAAATWLKERGLSRMIGPMNPSTNDECGFLCEGFDTDPRIMMPHTPPYYLALAEQCGLKKIKELYAYDMAVAQGPLDRLERLSAVARKKTPGLTVRRFDLKHFDREIQCALTVYNAAWEKNWGFVPWTDKEFRTIAGRLKDLLLLDTTLLAEVDGEPAGMLIAVPDYNYVLKKINGTLFPFGIFSFLYHRRHIDSLRLMILGVVKRFRQRGIEGVLYAESLKAAQQRGYRHCEFSWILDDNVMTQRAAEMMGGRLYKKYRVYGN